MPLPSTIIENKFPFEPTSGQKILFKQFDKLLDDKSEGNICLLVKGYAGTGKTTVISTLVNVLPSFNFKQVLMAPTGRAAKVMGRYSKKVSFTIHNKIYHQKGDPGKGVFDFHLQKNYSKNTIFIVDEASMLYDENELGKKGLLSDLIRYVFQNSSNRLMLVGDDAQLPPVGQSTSPALEASILFSKFNLQIFQAELKEVMRQEQQSGILFNATRLRSTLADKEPRIQFQTSAFKDIFKMSSDRMEDGIRYCYDKYQIENTIVVCRSNKQAVQYNHFIRRQILFREEELEVGDIIMNVRNNYYYAPTYSPAGFIANGDFMEVMKIIDFEEMYDLRFARLELRLLDYDFDETFEARVILDTLHAPSPSMSSGDHSALYHKVAEDYKSTTEKSELQDYVKNDPFYNALQIKYAYALTCHKSQGGQWGAVFVDQGYLKEDMINKEYVRWLYTAITRASKELFLVNFNPIFFDG
ncbi:MAG: AAA family ATPase [Cyclobacteriaceae bacterium]